MVKHNYTREQWEELPNESKARCVAYSRLSYLIEAHRQEALNIWAKRQQLRANQRRQG